MELDPNRPIWMQLLEEFERLIVRGEWPAGERISSVRELASAYDVNPNTIQRALAELERLGLCYSERTAGRFVTRSNEAISELRQRLAQSVATDFVDKAQGLSLDLDSAIALIRHAWEEEQS